MAESHVSPMILGGLKRHIQDGCPTGSFLRAVLTNDLFEAVWRADEGNLATLRAIVSWVHNNAPMDCYGSPARVAAWQEQQRNPETRVEIPLPC